MAYRLETQIKRFIGDSHEEKPRLGDPGIQTANDLPVGSSTLEEDTGDVYRWTGQVWATAPQDEGDSAYLAAIYQELCAARIERHTGLPVEPDGVGV